MPKKNVTFIKPEEPSFLKKLKEQAGYKEGPTVDTKREDLGPIDDRDFEDTEEEKPTVVVLNSGDLTAEEATREQEKLDRVRRSERYNLGIPPNRLGYGDDVYNAIGMNRKANMEKIIVKDQILDMLREKEEMLRERMEFDLKKLEIEEQLLEEENRCDDDSVSESAKYSHKSRSSVGNWVEDTRKYQMRNITYPEENDFQKFQVKNDSSLEPKES
ncbi:hypothetical protein HHI36_020185 [Cryptolaemus montrouzieri]|uniref:DUF4604 domain-containing protein n=1 Tax=Cryptolaemus montrouzieri TaxID=559131 RepID=A0ABD2N9U6_9CUCU